MRVRKPGQSGWLLVRGLALLACCSACLVLFAGSVKLVQEELPRGQPRAGDARGDPHQAQRRGLERRCEEDCQAHLPPGRSPGLAEGGGKGDHWEKADHQAEANSRACEQRHGKSVLQKLAEKHWRRLAACGKRWRIRRRAEQANRLSDSRRLQVDYPVWLVEQLLRTYVLMSCV